MDRQMCQPDLDRLNFGAEAAPRQVPSRAVRPAVRALPVLHLQLPFVLRVLEKRRINPFTRPKSGHEAGREQQEDRRGVPPMRIQERRD